jgi:amidase
MTMALDDIHYLTIGELADLLRTRALSPLEVARAQLERIGALDGTLASFCHLTAEPALEAARRAEREIVGGHYRGTLHGVPLAIKDLFWTHDAPTAAGMPIYSDFRPDRDATAVAHLREAGAVLLGKLQLTEGAYSDHHPAITPPRNPWDQDLWPGISSSGPAVATAAGLCFGSLASDTGGSIRWPTAATGLTGIKPTWGTVSRHGVVALAPSMDHVGPIARSATDAGAMLAAVAGRDANDPTSLSALRPSADRFDVKALHIGVDPAWNSAGVDAHVRTALRDTVDVFSALGARVVEISAPDVEQAVRDWTPLCAVEAAAAHQATFPAREAEYGPVLAALLRAGREVSGLDCQQIALRRLMLRGTVAALFDTVDLLLTPVHPFAPLSLHDIQTLGEQPELVSDLQRYTAPFDLTGNPTMTFPAGFTDSGAPIGLQLVGPDRAESRLIAAVTAFQHATPWHHRHPACVELAKGGRGGWG